MISFQIDVLFYPLRGIYRTHHNRFLNLVCCFVVLSLLIPFSIAQSTTCEIFGNDPLVGLVYFIKDQQKVLLFSCFLCKFSTPNFRVNNHHSVCCKGIWQSMFSSFAFHEQPALHVFKRRNILFSHLGKDMQNFHIPFLSDKCYYYHSAICSWLISFAFRREFSFVSHLLWLSHYFHLTSYIKGCNSCFHRGIISRTAS